MKTITSIKEKMIRTTASQIKQIIDQLYGGGNQASDLDEWFNNDT